MAFINNSLKYEMNKILEKLHVKTMEVGHPQSNCSFYFGFSK